MHMGKSAIYNAMNRILEEKQLNLWKIDIASLKGEVKAYRSFLNVEELVKANSYRFQKDHDTFVITRAVLRLLLGNYLKSDPSKLHFKYGKKGKPFLDRNHTSIEFNVSHSGSMAIVGIAEGCPLGVDIEYLKQGLDFLELANDFFSDTEIQILMSLPEEQRAVAFYRCWTRKESFIKAKGIGLSYPLDAFSVSLDSDESAKLENTRMDPFEKERWKMFSFIPKENYRAAVTVDRHCRKYELFDWMVNPDFNESHSNRSSNAFA